MRDSERVGDEVGSLKVPSHTAKPRFRYVLGIRGNKLVLALITKRKNSTVNNGEYLAFLVPFDRPTGSQL